MDQASALESIALGVVSMVLGNLDSEGQDLICQFGVQIIKIALKASKSSCNTLNYSQAFGAFAISYLNLIRRQIDRPVSLRGSIEPEIGREVLSFLERLQSIFGAPGFEPYHRSKKWVVKMSRPMLRRRHVGLSVKHFMIDPCP